MARKTAAEKAEELAREILRDQLAMAALVAYGKSTGEVWDDADYRARFAYRQADAMLRARDEE